MRGDTMYVCVGVCVWRCIMMEFIKYEMYIILYKWIFYYLFIYGNDKNK